MADGAREVHRRLGRTGVEVSGVGLGAGGSSRLGQRAGRTEAECAALVREAIDLGVDYIDTAAGYGTETIVGRGIKGVRDLVVLSTKANPIRRDGGRLDARGLRFSIERSLRNLGTDFIDVFYLHGIMPDVYDYSVAELVPEMLKQRDLGRIRFLGMSEAFAFDPRHEMLSRAVVDDWYDVVMLGFSIVNSSARDRFLVPARKKNVGVVVMYAVRRTLSNPEALRDLVTDLVDKGQIDGSLIDIEDPLGFLVREGGATSVIDAAYRYAAQEPGCHIVLTGTGSLSHLHENVKSISSPGLPPPDVERLEAVFGGLDSITGN